MQQQVSRRCLEAQAGWGLHLSMAANVPTWLAFVVPLPPSPHPLLLLPCQAGGRVLLQPHGSALAHVLPAVEKIAEWGRGKNRGVV